MPHDLLVTDRAGEVAPATPRREAAAAHHPALRALLPLLGIGLAIAVSLGLARTFGEGFRRTAMIEVRTGPAGSRPDFSDEASEAPAFFAARDTARIVVPWDMTVAELLALYHLEGNVGAWRALREQLNRTRLDERLTKGDELRIPLTPPEGTP